MIISIILYQDNLLTSKLNQLLQNPNSSYMTIGFLQKKEVECIQASEVGYCIHHAATTHPISLPQRIISCYVHLGIP